MRQRDRLTGMQVMLWSGLGVGAGLVAGFLLSEWVGGVNRVRVRGVARRLRQGSPTRLTSSASARAVEAALAAEPRLAGIPIEAMAVARGVVELRGWVPTRAARAIAGRAALAVPGIESVINSLLVRGEDDLTRARDARATDQSA
ncbi:MAG TPA: BON domain-containing protein [Gemmatimonadales bacterium]|nr:BON domain-containing protein [Gemmatimonadales bacterium]